MRSSADRFAVAHHLRADDPFGLRVVSDDSDVQVVLVEKDE